MNIMLAKHKHAERLSEIIQATFHLACPATSDRDLQSVYIARHLSAQHFQRFISDDQLQVWVALDSNEPVGLAVIDLKCEQSPLLSKLYVLPCYHGQGVAQKLYKAVIDYTKNSGYQVLNLLVYSGNVKAKAFYENQGFKFIGCCDFKMETELHKDHLYQRLIA